MNIDQSFIKFMNKMCEIQQKLVVNYIVSRGNDRKVVEDSYNPDSKCRVEPKYFLDMYNIRYISYQHRPGKFELYAGSEFLFRYEPGTAKEFTTGTYTYNSKYYGEKVES